MALLKLSTSCQPTSKVSLFRSLIEKRRVLLTVNKQKNNKTFYFDLPLLLLLLFIPGSGGTPFKEPSPLLPRDGAPLRDDSPPADLDTEKGNIVSFV